jgi:hypothetical protein
MSDSGFEFEPKTEITAEMRILPPLTKSRMHKRTTSLNFEIAMVKRVQKKQLPSLASVLKSIPGNRKLHGRVPQPVYSQLTAPFTYQKTSPTTTYPVYSPRPSPVPSSNAYPSPVFHQLPPSPQKGLDWLANVASNESAKMSPMISPKSSVSSPQFHKQSLKMSLASILS